MELENKVLGDWRKGVFLEELRSHNRGKQERELEMESLTGWLVIMALV